MRTASSWLAAVGVLAALAVALTLAVADSDIPGGSGADFYPTRNTPVVLESEHVFLTERSNKDWDVVNTMTFNNPTNKVVTVTLTADPYYQKPQVTVDGVETKVSMKIIRDVARQSHSLDRLYSFESSFAPSRRVIVRVVYTIDKPEDESRIMIPYHFGGQFFQTSGDAESEPKIEEIGFDFQFRSRVPLNIYVGYLGSGQTLKLVGRQRPLAPKKTSLAVNGHSVVYSASFCGRPLPRLTVKLFDVRPRGQLSFIGFRTGCATDEQHRCNGDLLNPGANASACWNSLNRYYSGGHGTITRLTKCFPPVYLRNFILASYGYNFTEEQWRHEFYDSGLFLPSTTPFEDSWLTPGDRAAIERLKKLEAQAATPPTPGAH